MCVFTDGPERASVRAVFDEMTDRRAWNAAFTIVAALTLLRLLVLFSTPLELYPDEAQYWLWSRTLDFGYFSKPPMIAWIIGFTTSLGGDAEPYVRLAAPLLHAGTALVLFEAARRLYGPAAGLVACLVYSLMPGVQLSSGVISTDAPLLFFLSLALLSYITLLNAPRVRVAAALGAAVGLAMLSKYAAAYAIGGIVLHLVVSREARGAWSPPTVLAALAALLLVLAPNLIWNVTHGFSTVEHTAANAHWDGDIGGLAEMGDFVGSQFGVFGPLPFAVLLIAILWAFRRKLAKEDVLLLCFSLPPLMAVTAQAFISRANANWAARAYVAGSVLVAALLVRWRARWWLIGGLGLQGVIAALFLAWVAEPDVANSMGASNSFKRAKGWEQNTRAIVERARSEGGLSAVAVDDRFLFNAAAYYGRDFFGIDGPPLKMWLATGKAYNQAEAEAPLTEAFGARVLAASLEGQSTDRMRADFASSGGLEIARTRLDPKRSRKVEMFVGERFTPAPRP